MKLGECRLLSIEAIWNQVLIDNAIEETSDGSSGAGVSLWGEIKNTIEKGIDEVRQVGAQGIALIAKKVDQELQALCTEGAIASSQITALISETIRRMQEDAVNNSIAQAESFVLCNGRYQINKIDVCYRFNVSGSLETSLVGLMKLAIRNEWEVQVHYSDGN
jgi:hypothetical protein